MEKYTSDINNFKSTLYGFSSGIHNLFLQRSSLKILYRITVTLFDFLQENILRCDEPPLHVSHKEENMCN